MKEIMLFELYCLHSKQNVMGDFILKKFYVQCTEVKCMYYFFESGCDSIKSVFLHIFKNSFSCDISELHVYIKHFDFCPLFAS